jgi:hypothetical protein
MNALDKNHQCRSSVERPSHAVLLRQPISCNFRCQSVHTAAQVGSYTYACQADSLSMRLYQRFRTLGAPWWRAQFGKGVVARILHTRNEICELRRKYSRSDRIVLCCLLLHSGRLSPSAKLQANTKSVTTRNGPELLSSWHNRSRYGWLSPILGPSHNL